MSDDLDKIKGKKLNITVENLVTIGFVIVTVTGMWYSLQGEIELAKELPEPPVSRTEFDLKDQIIRENIINTNEKVEEIDETVKKIDEKLFEIIKKISLIDNFDRTLMFEIMYRLLKLFIKDKIKRK